MSTPEPNKKRDYSRYDQMSTSELEQLLRLDFQAAERGDSDLDAILYISDLLAKRNSPADTDSAWEQFETKYRPYAHGRSLYDLDDGQAPQPQPAVPPAPPRFRPVRRLRRMALLAAALIACLLGAMAVAQAAGVDVLGAIARWTDETFVFVPAASGPPSGTSFDEDELAQLHASLQPLDMEGRFPTWYPEGFVPGELEITELHSSVSAHIIFFGEDCIYTVVVQHYTQPQTNTGIFEKDDTPVEQYVYHQVSHYIFSNNGSTTAAWMVGDTEYYMFASDGAVDMKALIRSAYEAV